MTTAKRGKGYIVEQFSHKKWEPTWWTDDDPPEDGYETDRTPKPATRKRDAKKALRMAIHCFPRSKYRIAEVER